MIIIKMRTGKANWRHLDEYSSLDEIFLNRIFGSEVVNFFIWFPEVFAAVSLLFPIHRAMWFQGGRNVIICDVSGPSSPTRGPTII